MLLITVIREDRFENVPDHPDRGQGQNKPSRFKKEKKGQGGTQN